MNEQQKPPRIIGVDVARAVAIAGMALIHFGLVLSIADLDSTWFGQFINRLSGRPATMFMILAGIGVALRMRGRDDVAVQTDVRASLVRRGVFFFVFGYMNLMLWPGDILRVYGIAYFLAACVLTVSNRLLIMAAAAVVAAFVGLMFVLEFETNWNFETLAYANLWTLSGGAMNLFFNGFRAVLPWVGLLFVGMLIGRLDLASGKVQRRLIFAGVALWLCAELTSVMLVQTTFAISPSADRETVVALFGTDSLPPMPMFMLSSGGLAIAVIASCIATGSSTSNRRVVEFVAAAGQLAFTWYIAHIVIVIAAGVLTDFRGDVSILVTYFVAAVFTAIMLATSAMYRKRFRHGPLEYVLRKLFATSESGKRTDRDQQEHC